MDGRENNPRRPLRSEDVLRRLRDVERKLHRIARREDLNEIEREEIRYELADLQAQLSGSDTRFTLRGELRPANAQTLRGLSRQDQRDLMVRARKGVDAVEIRRLTPNGPAEALIGDYDPIELPAMLTDLLEIIAKDSGLSDDEFVAWKPKAEVAIQLGALYGINLNGHTVDQRITRLRDRLLKGGPRNPFLVELDPQLGVRLRVRRKATRVIGGECL